MFSSSISSDLIRFKCVLGDLREHGLGGEGQRKAGDGHPDLNGLFGSSRAWPGRTCQRLGHLFAACAGHTAILGAQQVTVGWESREGLCNAAAGAMAVLIPISKSDGCCVKRRGTSAFFNRGFASFPCKAEC